MNAEKIEAELREKLDYARRLRKALDKNLRTQKELAQAVGRTQQCISRWLQGSYLPKITTQRKVVKFFGMTPEEFNSL